MSRRAILVLLLVTVPVFAQDDSGKRSAFPKKNREHDRAMALAAKRSASRASRSASKSVRTVPVTESMRTRLQPGATGKACFFSAAANKEPSATAPTTSSDELTAAHATYPLGSLVNVTNLANGKTLQVRIISRMSDSRRVISVSEAATRRLGFYEAGTADVKVDPPERTGKP